MMNRPIVNLITRYLFLSITSVFLASSCNKNEVPETPGDLAVLPKDTGEVQVPVYLNAETEYGYFAYTPTGYADNNLKYPLLVFLHGSGEKGNSSLDSTVLNKVLVHGPPKLIKQKRWKPKFACVVISPQCHEGGWNAVKLHRFLKQIIAQYRINTSRIYLTGLSMGGFGTFSYLQTYSDTGLVAAAVPICGGGNLSKAAKLKNIPLWAFHGDADLTVNVSNSINLVDSVKKLHPVLNPRLTIYPGVGHDSWTRTYDSSGMGTESKDYDAFIISIYDWMFGYSKQ